MNNENKVCRKKLCVKRKLAIFIGITAMFAGIVCVSNIFSEMLRELSNKDEDSNIIEK